MPVNFVVACLFVLSGSLSLSQAGFELSSILLRLSPTSAGIMDLSQHIWFVYVIMS